MGKVVLELDTKNPNRFIATTQSDVSMLGWETREKFKSYYVQACWANLVDLFTNAKALDLQVEYDSLVIPKVDALREELKALKEAQKIKAWTVDQIEEAWEASRIPYLFKKVVADLHQKQMILWLLAIKKGGCYAEQGLGKTVMGILMFGKLLEEGLIKKPLIVAPVGLLSDTAWFKDLASFSDYKPINLRKQEDFYEEDGDIYFINSDKFSSWCYKKTEKAEKHYDKENYFELQKFDAIFFDEASVLKDHSSLKSKAFLNFCDHAKYIAFASGTPAPNTIFQIWTQMKAIGSILGDCYSDFEQRYGVLRSVGPTQRYFPRKNAEMEIRKRIELVSFFIEKEKVMQLPERHIIDVKVDLNDEQMKLYKKIEEDYVSAVHGYGEDGEFLEGELAVEHEQTVRIKLLQILNGFVNIKDEFGKTQRVTLPWNAKLEKLKEMVQADLDEDPTNNIIIWCRFRHEIETIYEIYKDIGTFVYGGMGDAKRERHLLKWQDDPSCRIIIAHPKSCKFGFTWNKANRTYYYSATEDFEDFSQSRDRNYRRGQTREVKEYRFCTTKTIENRVWYAITQKKKLDKFLKDYYMQFEIPSRQNSSV